MASEQQVLDLQEELSAKDAEIERLKAQLSASEEKRKVLGAECQAWRADERKTDSYHRSDKLDGAIKATDAAKATEGI